MADRTNMDNLRHWLNDSLRHWFNDALHLLHRSIRLQQPFQRYPFIFLRYFPCKIQNRYDPDSKDRRAVDYRDKVDDVFAGCEELAYGNEDCAGPQEETVNYVEDDGCVYGD